MRVSEKNSIIIFDGICNLCDSAVRFIWRHDRKKRFLIISFESGQAKILLKGFGIEPKENKTIYLIHQKDLYIRSTAVLKIALLMPFPINICSLFFVIPRPLRDAIYDFISRNRYRWFGIKAVCPVDSGLNRD